MKVSVLDVKNKSWHLEAEKYLQSDKELNVKPKLKYSYDERGDPTYIYTRSLKKLN